MVWSYTKHHSISVLECSGSPGIIILLLSTPLRYSKEISMALQERPGHRYESKRLALILGVIQSSGLVLGIPFASIVITKYEIVVLVHSHYI